MVVLTQQMQSRPIPPMHNHRVKDQGCSMCLKCVVQSKHTLTHTQMHAGLPWPVKQVRGVCCTCLGGCSCCCGTQSRRHRQTQSGRHLLGVPGRVMCCGPSGSCQCSGHLHEPVSHGYHCQWGSQLSNVHRQKDHLRCYQARRGGPSATIPSIAW